MLSSNGNTLTPESYLASQVSSTATPKCAQLQVPGEKSPANNNGKRNKVSDAKLCSNTAKYNIKYLFEENADKLKNYIQITVHYKRRIKSFSTSDILEQINSECEVTSSKRYYSECDINNYLLCNTNKEINNDYITYSCSTLAICGDTIHSSQLPSPQTQSIRQLNSFIFSDLDLIKSINRKVRNNCIKSRIAEFMRCIDTTTMDYDELDAIRKITSNAPTLKPFKFNYEPGIKEYSTDQGDILVQVVDYEDKANDIKRDKELFVLNWLQTVECSFEPE